MKKHIPISALILTDLVWQEIDDFELWDDEVMNFSEICEKNSKIAKIVKKSWFLGVLEKSLFRGSATTLKPELLFQITVEKMNWGS